MTFDAGALLPDFGFDRVEGKKLRQWTYERPPISLNVIIGPNQYFRETLHFAGYYNDGRMMQSLEFSVALKTASREEAMALIAYNFRGLPRDRVPTWVIGGWALEEYLPWRRQKS